MKIASCFTLLLFLLFCAPSLKGQQQVKVEKEKISTVLDRMHHYASKADFDSYFSLFAKDFEFIGTESTEVWDLEAFKQYTQPYFHKGQGWTYTPLKRSVHVDDLGNSAYFHEVLDSAYGLCRGSGVLKKVNGEWKLQQYVLSILVPNSVAKKVVEIKKEAEARERTLLKNETK